MQKLNSIVKSTNVFRTSTAFQRTELLKKLCQVLYSFCEYKLRNVTIQCYIVSVNTNEGVGLAVWIWESENNLLGNPLCTKLCVFTAHHFEKLQCLLYLVDLEMYLSHSKLVHHHLDKMERSVWYTERVGIQTDQGQRRVWKSQPIHEIALCSRQHTLWVNAGTPRLWNMHLLWNLNRSRCMGSRNHIIRKFFS